VKYLWWTMGLLWIMLGVVELATFTSPARYFGLVLIPVGIAIIWIWRRDWTRKP
jgi:hypothetical protein